MSHSLSILVAGVLCSSFVFAQDGEWSHRFLAGHRALEAGMLESARSGLESALVLEPMHAATAWALACVAAKEGETEEAFTWLDRVEEWGGADRALLEWDLGLASLRGSSRFADLAARWEEADEFAGKGLVGTPSWAEGLDSVHGPWSSAAKGESSAFTASMDGVLREFDLRTGRTLLDRKIADSPLRSIQCGPDGQTLCVLAGDGTTLLLRAEGLVVMKRWEDRGGERRRYSLARYSPDGKLLAISDGKGRVRVVDTGTGEDRWQGSGFEKAQRFSWSDDSKGLLLRGGRHELRRVAFESPGSMADESTFRYQGGIGTFGYQPGSSDCFVGTRDGFVLKIDTRNGGRIGELSNSAFDVFRQPASIGSIDFNSSGSRVILGACGVGPSLLLDTERFEVLWNYSYGAGNPAAVPVEFSEDDRFVHLGRPGTLYPARTVEAETGKLAQDIGAHARTVEAQTGLEGIGLRWTPAGIQVFDREFGAVLYLRADHSNGPLLLAPSGHLDANVATLREVHLQISGVTRPLIELATSLLDPKRVRAAADGIALRPAVIR